MEHDTAIIVHAANAEEAESTAAEIAGQMCEEGVFGWVEDAGPVHELDSRWTDSEATLEENLPTLLDNAPEGDPLARYLRRTLSQYDEAINAILLASEESTTTSGRDVFAKEEIMENFRRVGQERGWDVHVYDQGGNGVNTARDLKYALSTGDFANQMMIEEEEYRPFLVEVRVE